ncbi:DNRLRE domain-containing protein, partial [bacterium]
TRTYECDRIVKDWEEGTVTWGDQPDVEGLGPKAVAIGTVPDWVSWDVKSWVQGFVSGEISATPNYGWMIRDGDEDSTTSYESVFYSQESDTDLRPSLTISYYPPHLELETYGSGFEAGNWVKMTVRRKDFNNVAVNRGDLNVRLSSTSVSANKRFSITLGGAPINELFIENGSGSKDFWYYDDKVGTCAITVWTGDYLYYGDDGEQQIIRPGALHHFAFAHMMPLVTAAVPFPTTITALDAYGNVVIGYNGTNALSDATGTMSPTVTGAFVNGVWSGNVVINEVADNVKISTSGAGRTGESGLFDVIAGPPVKISIAPADFTMAAEVQYSSLTIELEDANGFGAEAVVQMIVNLASTSAHGEFRQAGGTAKITSVTMQAGSSSVGVDYYDIRAGTWTLTASAAGLASGTSIATVLPDTTPPVTAIAVGSPKFKGGTTLYVSEDTTFALTVTDEASGVKETKYRIDGGSWNAYSEPFTLAAYSEGAHVIGCFSADKANNTELEVLLTAHLDATPPSIQALGPSGSIIARSGSMNFTATVDDEGSGVASVELLLDGTTQGTMAYVNATYSKTVEVATGTHGWRVRATDNVGEIAETPDIAFYLSVDNAPPTISNVMMSPASPSMGEAIR